MALPEQIRRQTEAVQELYKQLNADDNTGTDTAPADGTVAPVGNAANTPPADENTVSNNAAPSPASEQKPGADNVPEETVLQKYKTLQGMYNAEVPRLHQQNREMAQRVQQMEQLLASLSAQQQSAAAPSQPVVDKLVTDKDVEEYGDSLDVMRKVSREELIPVVQRLAQIESMLRQMQANVVPQVQNLAQRQQMSAEQQFWADLATNIPNFREINGNEAFQSWLLEADPLTGITRQTYLDDAQRSLDARRVANFFRTWLEITGQAAVAQSTGNAAASELEKQVAPGRSRGAGAATSTNKAKTYSPQDIQKFFNDVRSGKYKGREQERDRTERDIFAAQREGRIVANA
jgi:hypothetical protein